MRTFKQLMAALMLTTAMPAAAQSEGGLIVGAEAEKKIDSHWSMSLEADMRTRNDFKTMDRWTVGVGGEYKFNKYLKANAGYILMNNNFHEKISYKANGAYNNWRPSYWGIRHRVYASVTGTYKFKNNIRLSLRERWQYTYRPDKTTQRWDFDNEYWEDKVVAGKAKHQLRSRLQIEYDKKKALLTPYANVELFNSLGIESVRYTVGTDIRLAKQHSLQVYYRFKNTRNVDENDYDPNMHYLGLGYKFKL